MDESILMNYLRGGCNDEECQQVELWCEEAPENRQILEQLYYTLFVGDRMAVMDAVDTEASLTKFKSLVREEVYRFDGDVMRPRQPLFSQVLFSQAELRGDCFPINFLIIQ
mgnify:CR=1 FL=1